MKPFGESQGAFCIFGNQFLPMRGLLTFLLIACCMLNVHSQSSLKKLLDRNVPCAFEGVPVKLDTALYGESRNVSYSYAYTYPKYFKEVWPQEEVVSEVRKQNSVYIDTVTYTSPDEQASLKVYAGQVIPFPLGSKRKLQASDVLAAEKAVDDYIKLIKAGRDKQLGKVKIGFICKGIKGYNYSICLKATKGDTQYIYKIILAEMPATGELIFSHFLYKYSASVKDKYEALGITLANTFKVDE